MSDDLEIAAGVINGIAFGALAWALALVILL